MTHREPRCYFWRYQQQLLVGCELKKTNLNTLLSLLIAALLLNSCSNSSVPTETSNVSGNRSVMNGREVKEDEYRLFGGVVALLIGGKALCTGVHLGKGYILTAHHCVAGDFQPNLDILSLSTKTVYKIGTSYTASMPRPEGYMEVGEEGSAQPQPDLALVKTTGKAAEAISKLPTVRLGSSTLAENAKSVYIAGFGRNMMSRDEQADDGAGKLRIGAASIAKVTDLFYLLQFKKGTTAAAGLPGDSGGPLLRVEDGKITVYGIASIFSSNKSFSQGGNYYVRLSQKPVIDWLDKYFE